MAFAATRMLRSYAIRDHTHIAFNRHHPWASGLVGLPLTQTARADLIGDQSRCRPPPPPIFLHPPSSPATNMLKLPARTPCNNPPPIYRR